MYSETQKRLEIRTCPINIDNTEIASNDTLCKITNTINNNLDLLLTATAYLNTAKKKNNNLLIEVRIEYLQFALDIFKMIKCDYSLIKIPIILLRMSTLYFDIKKYDKSIEVLKEAITSSKILSDGYETVFEFSCYIMLDASFCSKKSIPHYSSSCFQKAYEIAKNYGFKGNDDTLDEFSFPDLFKTETDSAKIKFYESKIAEYKNQNDDKLKMRTAEFLGFLGVKSISDKKVEIGLNYLKRSLDICETLNNIYFSSFGISIVKIINNTYLTMGKIKEMFELSRRQISKQVSLGNRFLNYDFPSLFFTSATLNMDKRNIYNTYIDIAEKIQGFLHVTTDNLEKTKKKITKECNVCNDEGIYMCSNCNIVRYCCKEHQQKDWIEHKKECNSVKSIFPENLLNNNK